MSVPRNRFLAMEMETVYTTVGQREKLLDNLEKNIKRDLLEVKRKELKSRRRHLLALSIEKQGKEVWVYEEKDIDEVCSQEKE